MLRRLLIPSFALLLAACGGQGGSDPKPQAPARRAAAIRPEGSFCVYTYLDADPRRGGARIYRAPVARYFRHHGPPSAAVRGLLERHLDLAQAHYATHLAGSQVRIFHCAPLRGQDLLETRLDWIRSDAPGADLAETEAEWGPIRYHLRRRPYRYRAFEGYVASGAPEIGGGLLSGKGLAREGLPLLETNFLPRMAEVRASPEPGLLFCPGVSLKNLDSRPVVLQVRRFLELADLRGGDQPGAAGPADAERRLRLLDHPQDLYLLALAAGNGPGARCAEADILQSLILATRGFTELLLALHADGRPLVVHTGPWGAGAFPASPEAAWAIQRAAIEAAYVQFALITGASPQLDFHYEAGDRAGVRAANRAHRVIANACPAHRTLADYGMLVHQRVRTDPDWQAR